MKNNNNNNNIVELTTFGYVYDSVTKLVYPMLKKGGYCTHESESILDFFTRVRGTDMPMDDFDAILELGDTEVNYQLWKADNVITIGGKYSTQCTLYRNLLTEEQLKDYYIKSFCDESVQLRYEVETSGDWVEMRGIYINCEDGRMCDEGTLHYGDCFDTNITDKDGVEYLEQMNEEELKFLARFFPRTIADFKMKQIREKAEYIAEASDDLQLVMTAREIIALTK